MTYWVFAALFILSSLACSARGAEYYIDFDKGKDTGTGTSPKTAFRHCPGDPAATGKVAKMNLQPGDTVFFKGGVHYRGAIVIKTSGSEEKPIVFDGNTAGAFGKGRAIIDGSEILADWQKCLSADECFGNPDWKNIYWTNGPAGTGTMSWNIVEDGELLSIAENPDSDNPYLVTPKNYLKVSAKKATATSVIDERLKEMGGEKLKGALIAVYCKPNWIHFTKITGFEPSSNRLTFAKHKGIRTFYPEFSYSILNHPLMITRPGEYVFDESTSRIYLWPRTKGEIAKKKITISRRPVGIDLQGVHHVTLRGFRVQQFACGLGESGGTAVKASGDGHHLLIQNNELTMNRSMVKQGVLHMHKITRSVIEKNHVFHNPFYRVLVLDGYNDSIVRDNELDTNSGTGLVCFRVQRTTITGNTIKNHVAVHSQAMAIYAKCADVTITDNRVEDGLAVTVQDSLNVTVRNNIFDARGNGFAVGLWNGGKATVVIENNIITGSASSGWSKGLSLFSNNGDKASRFEIRGNIIDGIGGSLRGEIANNVFLIKEQYDKHKDSGNILEPDKKKIFIDPDKGDYRYQKGYTGVVAKGMAAAAR